jgi:PleD family two-component response regulator
MQHFHNDTTHNRKMILVIDDDFDILNFIKLSLQKTASLNVSGFTDPNLALEHFEINAALLHE